MSLPSQLVFKRVYAGSGSEWDRNWHYILTFTHQFLISDFPAITRWCTEQFGPMKDRWNVGTSMIGFKTESDMTLFMMRWNGERNITDIQELRKIIRNDVS